MAVNNAAGSHPWRDMDDGQLLRSAGLYGIDRVTGQQGYNLAAVMLFGKDDVIQDVVPAYVTDALVRRVDRDRYDDREIVKTNLVESYEQLMGFARKHLPDKFFLEGDQRKSLRNIIAREMLVNTLIHRELTSSYVAKFVIEKDKMYVENANRAEGDRVITPENLEPNPKNPVIAAFFRNIGYSDQLGSGVRNLFKYTKFYSGREPEFREGDVFRITVPLDDAYSFDYENDVEIDFGKISIKSFFGESDADKVPIKAKTAQDADKMPVNSEGAAQSADGGAAYIDVLQDRIPGGEALTDQQLRILAYARIFGTVTSRKVMDICQVKQRRARTILKEMVDKDILSRQGTYKSTVYRLNKKPDSSDCL